MKSNCPDWPTRIAGCLLMSSLGFNAWAAGAGRAAAPPPSMTAPPVEHAAPAKASKAPSVPAKLVDINSASPAQLKTLPGVGDAEAARIIAGRPYLSKAELVIKNVLPTGPYLQLRHHVVAMPKTRPKGKG